MLRFSPSAHQHKTTPMQLNFRLLPVLTLAFITAFTSCRKESTAEVDTSNEVKAHNDDQATISTELDGVAADANIALESDAYFSGRVQNPQNINNICGGTATADTTSDPRTITISYDGNNCAGTHFRSGTVVLSMPAGTRWRHAGAALTITYQNFKVKRLSDNKSITINGAQTLTNVSGGLLIALPTQQAITHTVTSNNMSITFEDGSQRIWHIARKRDFTFNNGVVLAISGIGAAGSITNAAEWGTNRFGRLFTTSIINPLVFRQDCNGRLTAGQIKHEGFATSTVTFGLNASGLPTSCPGTNGYYYKLTWTGPAGNSASAVLPY